MSELAFKSATALAAMIQAKEISAQELLEHYLDRVERYNPALNAIIVHDVDRARIRACEADQALARGESWGRARADSVVFFNIAQRPFAVLLGDSRSKFILPRICSFFFCLCIWTSCSTIP